MRKTAFQELLVMMAKKNSILKASVCQDIPEVPITIDTNNDNPQSVVKVTVTKITPANQ